MYRDFQKVFDEILKSDAGPRLTTPRPQSSGSYLNYKLDNNGPGGLNVHEVVTPPSRDHGAASIKDAEAEVDDVSLQIDVLNNEAPHVIWIVGGPGSSKARRMEQIAQDFQGWRVISSGKLLWNLVQSRQDKDEQGRMVGTVMRKGELVPQVCSSFCKDFTNIFNDVDLGCHHELGDQSDQGGQVESQGILRVRLPKGRDSGTEF